MVDSLGGWPAGRLISNRVAQLWPVGGVRRYVCVCVCVARVGGNMMTGHITSTLTRTQGHPQFDIHTCISVKPPRLSGSALVSKQASKSLPWISVRFSLRVLCQIV